MRFLILQFLGFESKHNLAYWKQVEYYGFGAGASSYLEEKRYTNVSDIRKYIEQINADKDVKILEEVQDFESKLNEYMMLGLRIIDGVNIQEVNDKFKVDVLEIYKIYQNLVHIVFLQISTWQTNFEIIFHIIDKHVCA